MPKHVVVLSLGAGIHSTALAIMLERETLPGFAKPDWAIFADTMSESPHTYETLDWLQPLLSFPIIRTSWGGRPTRQHLEGPAGRASPRAWSPQGGIHRPSDF